MKLSIVIINYNIIGLIETIGSVIGQTWKEFEFIIIDGGSYDRNVEVIKSHSSNIYYWTSEKHNGVYHAMNKIVAKATSN